jgi:hypothetical protein
MLSKPKLKVTMNVGGYIEPGLSPGPKREDPAVGFSQRASITL